MSDPYSTLLARDAPQAESDPYAELLAPKTPAVPAAPPSTPDIYSLVPDGPPQTARTDTPSIVDYPIEAGKRLLMPFPEQIVADPLRAMGVAASTGGLQVENRDLPAEQATQQQLTPEDVIPPAGGFSYPKATDLRESQLYRAGEAVSDWSREFFAPKDILHPVVNDLLSGFGSLAANIAQASIPVIGAPSLALTAPMQGISEAAQAAVKFGATPEQQMRAATLGSVSGATEFVDALLPQLGTPGRVAKFLGAVGAKIAVGAFVEGGQEGLQKLIQNAIAKNVYNPNQAYFEEVPYNALIGAIVGGAAKPIIDRTAPATAPTVEEASDAYQGLVGGTPPPGAPAASLSPIEQVFANPPPATPTEAHIQESAPFSPGADATTAAIAPTLMTPPDEAPVRKEALKPKTDDELLQSIYDVLGTPEALPPAQEKKKPVAPNAPLNIYALEKIGPQLGSNPGGVYRDKESGQEYYIKTAKSPAHATNELVAAALYKLAGVSTLEYVPAGPNHVATKMLPLTKKNANELTMLETYAAQSDFVTHAWLGNWDAVGLGGDNVGATNAGPVWLDLGGALEYRAMGAPKGAAFGSTVGELQTLLDPATNKDAASVFGGMSDARLALAAQKVLSINNDVLWGTVIQNGGSKELATKLIARKHDIKQQLGKLLGSQTITKKTIPITQKLEKAVESADFVLGSKEDNFLTKYLNLDATQKAYVDGILDAKSKVAHPKGPYPTNEENTAYKNGGLDAKAGLVAGYAKFALVESIPTNPDQWSEALIAAGESKKLTEKEIAEDVEALVTPEPKFVTPSAVTKHWGNSLIPLSEATKAADPISAKAEILAHNKKISAKHKAEEKGSYYYPIRVSTKAKKWKLYHGSHVSTPFAKFKNPLEKYHEKGIFFTPNKGFAKAFAGGGVVYEVLITPGKTRVVDLFKAVHDKKFVEAFKKYKGGDGNYLKQMQKSHTEKTKKLQQEKKDFMQKYGVPKLLPPPKTGYDWGGIHTAIEMAREEGFDTVILRNIDEGGGSDQIVVLSPNRVFNTKTKQMMFQLSLGGQTYNTSKLTPEAATKREQLIGEVEKLLLQMKKEHDNALLAKYAIQQVVGLDASQRVITPREIKGEQPLPEWGGGVGQLLGFYSPQAERDMALPLIAVSVGGTSERALVTAYHEGWHAIEGTLTADEVAILRSETEAMRDFLQGQNPKNAALYAKAQAEEIWAETAAYYSYSRTYQMAKAYQGPASQVLEKIYQLMQAIKQVVNELGFSRSADIFQAFYRGEMASRREGLPGDMLERWWAQEAGHGPSLAQVSEKLERNSERNSAALQKVDPELTHAPAQMETLHLHDLAGKLFSMQGAPGVVPPPVQQAIAHVDVMAKRHKWGWGLDRLVDLNPKFWPLLRYREILGMARTDTAKFHNLGISIAKQWRRLPDQDNLAHFIDEIMNMTYLSQQEKAQGITRHPTQKEFDDLRTRLNVSAASLKVFGRVKQAFEVMLDHYTQNAIEEAKRTISDPVALTNKVDAIIAQKKALLKRPYFPAMRFGSHWVMVKDAKGATVVFETFERKGIRSAEAVQMAAKAELMAKYPKSGGFDVTQGTLPENVQPFIGLPPTLLESIQRELMSMPTSSGQMPGLSAQQINAIEQLRFQFAPAASFTHHFQNKKFVKGYSEDFLRAFSRYMFHGGRYYSRVKYGWALREQLATAEKMSQDGNDNKLGAISSYMNDHFYNTVLDTKGDFGALRGFVFFWFFGGSIAAATTNLSQVPMITFPTLAAKFGGVGIGHLRAKAALLKALTKQANFFRKETYKSMTGFEAEAFAYAVETGRISESQAADLAAIAQGNTLLGLGNDKWRRNAQKILEWSVLPFELAEQFNRRVTFSAALDLAKKHPNSVAVSEAMNKYKLEYDQLLVKGFNPSDARTLITALHMVEQTQFVYAKENRPRFMRGRVGGLVFVFMNYLVQVLQHIGANKRSILPTWFVLQLAVAGLMGLPGAEDLEDIITFVGKKMFGKDFDAYRLLREWMVQMAGDKADIILHGLARRGLGLPALVDTMGEHPTRGLSPPAFDGQLVDGTYPGTGHSNNIPLPVLDRSKAFGMGRILPIAPGEILDPFDIDKAIARQTQNASGAFFGIGFNLLRAVAGPNAGEAADFKRWEMAMPRSIAAASRAYRAFSEERERGQGGPNSAATIINYDPRDTEQMMEIIAMGLGYQPARLTAQWDKIRLQAEHIKRLQLEQRAVIENRYEAHMGGRDEEIERAKKAVEDFNEGLPDWASGYRITADTLERSFEARSAERNAKESGIPRQHRDRGIADYFLSIFPESVVDVRKVR